MPSVKLKSGKFITSEVLEITAFPKADIIDDDNQKALEMNLKSFSQILFELHNISDINSTVLEILFVSEKIENQTFTSKVRVFIIVRKCTGNSENINAELEVIRPKLIQAKFEIKKIKLNDKSFVNLIKNIDCSNVSAIAKSEKITGSSISYGNYYTWDILNNHSEDTMSDLIYTISQNQNCAVSFQIIPTKINQTELTYLNELSSQYRRTFSMGDASAEYPSKTTQYILDRSQKPLFFYNICIFGNLSTGRIITTKVLSLLQSGNERISDCNLTHYNLTSEKINLTNHFYVYPWIINEKMVNKYRISQLQQYPFVKAIGRLPYIMTLEELNVFFRLPLYDKSMPALNQKRDAGTSEQINEEIFDEENTIKIGNLVTASDNTVYIGCPMKSWTQHALIVGMPGTGKTTFAVNILTQFYKKGVPFLAIEPTKTEYRAMIDAVDNLQIFTPGNTTVSPFIINPFLPPKGIKVGSYKSSLISAFKAAFSMDGPLEQIFVKSINACYIEYGWKEYSKYGDSDVTAFGIFEYILCFKRIMKTDMRYSAETKSNIETAGLLRLMNLIEQSRDIYDSINTVPIEDLLTKPTVLELNAIDNDEQKALIMALLLASACVYIKNNPSSEGQLKNVILIDEAHVLLDSGTDSENSGKSKGTTVKTIQKMIAEVRSYGTGIIIADQKPSKVTDDIIDNTDVKISFRLSSLKERSLIATSTDMPENDSEHISRLSVGQAFVHFERLESQPLLVQTEDTRARDGIRLTVSDEEIMERSTYWNDKKQSLIPFRECVCSTCCRNCSYKIRSDAEYLAEKLLIINKAKIKDKKAFLNYAIRIPKVLRSQVGKYTEEEIKQLYNCTIIKFIRKAELNLPYVVSLKELKQVIELSNRN